MTFLDTNILLRYLTGDDAHKASRCEQFLSQVAAGKHLALTHTLAVAEAVWVLTGSYRLAKERVADALITLLTLDGIRLDDKDRVLSALAHYRDHDVDFIDAYHVQFMRDRGVQVIYSYDTDFDTIPGIRRLEP